MKDPIRILITGGSGSLGRAVLDKLSKQVPVPFADAIHILARNEYGLWQLQQRYPELDSLMTLHVGDIRDKDRVDQVMRDHEITHLLHLAALKQVGMAEQHPGEARRTNVKGSLQLLQLAQHHAIDRMVVVSSDKAVQPRSMYGQTKAQVEQAIARQSPPDRGSTEVMIYRPGNFFGSRGSVVEVFENYGRQNQPLPVHNQEMTRFVLPLEQAADDVVNLLLSSTLDGMPVQPGFWVPRCRSIRIRDLAEVMQQGAGWIESGRSVNEKIHECLLTPAEHQRAQASSWGWYFTYQQFLESQQVAGSNPEDGVEKASSTLCSDADENRISMEELRHWVTEWRKHTNIERTHSTKLRVSRA
ncbi:MAG: polysaccharide biosynthesis protein [Bacteroidota bacterium]